MFFPLLLLSTTHLVAVREISDTKPRFTNPVGSCWTTPILPLLSGPLEVQSRHWLWGTLAKQAAYSRTSKKRPRINLQLDQVTLQCCKGPGNWAIPPLYLTKLLLTLRHSDEKEGSEKTPRSDYSLVVITRNLVVCSSIFRPCPSIVKCCLYKRRQTAHRGVKDQPPQDTQQTK